eukprot:TRINITY_DN11522_c0_g2_i5.p2 TRINITY_DN11522_c0_g2~~TRINITY_DN11522_c0_g2_i5.p2  ORF type:complete len:105 (-),score=16.27 TRINITY_DN11522_c0_g2_i5:794-1108(-)
MLLGPVAALAALSPGRCALGVLLFPSEPAQLRAGHSPSLRHTRGKPITSLLGNDLPHDFPHPTSTNPIQYNTTQYNTTQTRYNTTQSNTIQHNPTQSNTIQHMR